MSSSGGSQPDRYTTVELPVGDKWIIINNIENNVLCKIMCFYTIDRQTRLYCLSYFNPNTFSFVCWDKRRKKDGSSLEYLIIIKQVYKILKILYLMIFRLFWKNNNTRFGKITRHFDTWSGFFLFIKKHYKCNVKYYFNLRIIFGLTKSHREILNLFFGII